MGGKRDRKSRKPRKHSKQVQQSSERINPLPSLEQDAAAVQVATTANIIELENIKETYEKFTLQINSLTSTQCNTEFIQNLASDITAFHILTCNFMRKNGSRTSYLNLIEIDELNKLKQENKELEENVQELTNVYTNLKHEKMYTEKGRE